MNGKLQRRASQFTRARQRKNRWMKVVTGMAAVVVFCTTYALILPAITMEKEPACGKEAHIHTEQCYAPLETVPVWQMVCTPTSGNGSGCADFVVHRHDAACYDSLGNLVCTLPEMVPHTHTDGCYEVPETHVHTEECYTLQRGELTCTVAEGTSAHTHSVEGGCFEQREVLLCGLEESEGHCHTESCRGTEQALVCTLEETPGHQHTDDCYRMEKELICTRSTEPAEPRLICTQPEIVLHTHTEDCYDPSGNLTCHQIQVQEHFHTDGCFQTVLQNVDSKALTCTLPEDEKHTHSALCYGAWELTCELEAHTHDLACYADPGADVETAADWEAVFANVELTGEYHKDVLRIAETQLGYRESTRNYVVDGDGTVRGYTRYGQWYGDPWGDWCGMFVSFCLHYAEVEQMPLDSGCRTWIETLSSEEYDLYRAAGEYTPQPGELVFFDWDEDEQADHVGLVAELIEGEEPAIKTIEGNSTDRVQYVTYEPDSPEILGYGLLPEKELPTTLTAVIYTDETYAAAAEDTTVITVTGDLPEDVAARAYPIEVELEGKTVLAAYDITLFRGDGTVYQPEEPVTVRFTLPQVAAVEKDEALSVLYVPAEGEAETMNSTVEEGGISFEAPHFSGYVVALSGDGYPTCEDPESCEMHSKTEPGAWGDSTIVNPFGGAQGYNLFLLGDMTNWGVVHGNAAIMGNIYGPNNDISYDLASLQNYSADITPHFEVGLLLGGERDPEGQLTTADPVIVKNGTVIAQESQKNMSKIQIDNLNITGDHFHVESAERIGAYFESAKADLIAENQYTYDYCTQRLSDGDPHKGEILVLGTDVPEDTTINLVQGGALVLHGEDSFYNVFNLTPEQYKAINNQPQIVYLDVPFGSYTLINIIGEGVVDFAPALQYKDSNGKYISQPADKSQNPDYTQTQRTLINIDPRITQLTASVGNYIYASILGPNATFHVASGKDNQLQGTIVLKGLETENPGNPSGILYNPFNAGAQIKLKKSVACDSREDSCFIGAENEKTADKWSGCYVDLTLESVDDLYARSIKMLYVEQLPLDGTEYVINGLTPGVYQVTEEFVYKLGENGEKIPVESGDGDDDDLTWLRHYFGYAQFKEGDAETATLTVNSGDWKTAEIVNHYSIGETTSHAVSKQWKDENGSTIAPPVGAKVQVQLWRQTVDRSQDPEAVGQPVTLSAENSWYYRWDGLEAEYQQTVSYQYYVTEADGWPGFVLEGSGTVDPTTGIELLVNREIDIDGALMVKKVWKNQDGNTINPPENESVNLRLYRREGSVNLSDKAQRTLTIQIDTGKGVISAQKTVADGAKLDFDMRFFVNAADVYVSGGPLQYSVKDFEAVGVSVQMKSNSDTDQYGLVYENGSIVFQTPYYQVRYIGSVECMDRDITLRFTPKDNAAGTGSVDISASGLGTHSAVEIVDYNPTYSIDMVDSWSSWTQYTPTDGQPASITFPRDGVSASERWYYEWRNLPKDDGSGTYYAYFVFEDPLSGYDTTYLVNGSQYEAKAPDAAGDYPGLTEGYLTVINQEAPAAYELPDTGGIGTIPYTLGGMLLLTATPLMYNKLKRRKEDRASS